MILSEDQIIEMYSRKSMHCSRNTLPPYEHDWTCFACG